MQKTLYLLIMAFFLTISCEKNEDKSTLLTAENKAFLDLVNNLRSEGCDCGNEEMPPVPVLGWNDKLAQAALKHSRDMVKENFFSHTGSNGSSVADRITEEGYTWETYGENLAWGYASVEQVFDAWLDSPLHCKNMMNPVVKELGLGMEKNYWTLNLAKHK